MLALLLHASLVTLLAGLVLALFLHASLVTLLAGLVLALLLHASLVTLLAGLVLALLLHASGLLLAISTLLVGRLITCLTVLVTLALLVLGSGFYLIYVGYGRLSHHCASGKCHSCECQ